MKIIAIFYETVTILLFNNEINITNKTILSFNFTLFILNTKKGKKKSSTQSWVGYQVIDYSAKTPGIASSHNKRFHCIM